jgi:hypothetical protein
LQDKESFHRVIVGRDYYEPQNVSPQVRSCWLGWWEKVVVVLRTIMHQSLAASEQGSVVHAAAGGAGAKELHDQDAVLCLLSLQDTVERVFAFLLKKKVVRQTEGTLAGHVSVAAGQHACWLILTPQTVTASRAATCTLLWMLEFASWVLAVVQTSAQMPPN